MSKYMGSYLEYGHPLEGIHGDWVYVPSEGTHAPPIVQLYGPWPGEGWREMRLTESVEAHTRAMRAVTP